ncbi:MAG: PhnD/SsuA/transferrin family substrate-binding protein [Pseudomonadota bacterium]
MPNAKLSSFKFVVAILVAAVLGLSPGTGNAQGDDVFRVGWVTRGDEALEQRLTPFLAYVQENLGRPAELYPAPNGKTLIDALAARQIDYAALTGTGFAVGQSSCSCLIPIASPSTVDGHTHLQSVLLAKPGIEVPRQDEVLGGSPSDFFTYQVPNFAVSENRASLFSDGINLASVASLEALFTLIKDGDRRPVFAWTYATPGTQTDKSALTGFAAALVGEQPSLDVSWQSELFRIGPHAASNAVPEEDRLKLVEALVKIDDAAPLVFDVISPSLGGGFIPAAQGDYDNYMQILQALLKAE